MFRNISLFVVLAVFLFAFSSVNSQGQVPGENLQSVISASPKSIKLESVIPENAEIIWHNNKYVFVSDRFGKNSKQITFEKTQYPIEHVCISHDHKFIIVNTQPPNRKGIIGGVSKLWLYDLENKTIQRFIPDFLMVGNGGVDIGPNGYVYFAGIKKLMHEKPSSPKQFIANAAANDIYRIRLDGTGLERIVQTDDRGEADVSVSHDGKYITYQNLHIPTSNTEIWSRKSDGSEPKLVITAGKPEVDSVHDPEHSSDNSKIIFSRVNSKVKPVRIAKTAHDLWVVNLDGIGLHRLTKPGLLSIVPDWHEDGTIVYMKATNKPWAGVALIKADGGDSQTGTDIFPPVVNLVKWIPKKK